MNLELNVFLIGFSPFETATFESLFKMAGRRDTTYKIVSDSSHAHVLMVNSDSPAGAQFKSSSVLNQQKALFIGAPDPSGKWPCVPRPIKLTTVLSRLDVLMVVNKPGVLLTPQTSIPARSEATVFATSPSATPPRPISTAYVKGPVTQGSGDVARGSSGSSSLLGLAARAPSTPSTQQFDDILVVDDSDVAQKFMQNRLARYGFRAELVYSGEEALARVATERYKFVFLDVMMEGMDGYQTCRAIKQRKYTSGQAPIVVMLTSRGASMDKIRGGLAGCNEYLTKPLNEAELLKVLSKYDEQVERSFRDTNIGWSRLNTTR